MFFLTKNYLKHVENKVKNPGESNGKPKGKTKTAAPAIYPMCHVK